MKKLFLVVFLCTAFLMMGTTASAIPQLGVGGGTPGDPGLDTAWFDPLPFPASGGKITVWYGSDSTKATLDTSSDIWLLTNSANGDDFSFNGNDFIEKNSLQHNPYFGQPNIYGVNLGPLTEASPWQEATQTFYTYQFDYGIHPDGTNQFWFLNGDLDTGPGANIGDWLYVVLDNGGKILGGEFSPPTTSGQAVPEPATLLLLGGGLVGLAGFGRKRFKK